MIENIFNENSASDEVPKKNYDELDEEVITKLRNNEITVDETVKNLEKWYKDELLDYCEKDCPSNDEIFAQYYHQMVHSSSLQDILLKEKNYASKISSFVLRMEQEIGELNQIQQEVMDSKINLLDVETTSDDINQLLAQQYSASNLMRKQYESELEAKKGHQRNEYREWITSQIGNKLMSSSDSTPVGNKASMFPNVCEKPFQLEESFTIYLGSQLKSMHNIRILAADITDLCSPLVNENNELMINGNIQLGVYSSSLCGIVVLVPPGKSQVSANKKIIRNANLSTEFHFDPIDTQLESIQDDLKKINEGSSETSMSTRLKPGDFFITKHSNLSQAHLIFHLVYDDSTTEMNSRHPCILGLRNILKVANSYDCHQLTIPALLKHQMSEEMTMSWCVRRAELVLKCTKGFMIESSSWSGSELSTLQLLLPHDISEELFMTISSMVPNIFRVANPKIL
ncbi:CLUMA_CG002597, isoform A [Clunio marinus]|uniref:CLUMA_CG002597, isoform A n=1 Tax=Clunio marinus TaxID=568069 RepID=A0A1J1HQI4_9DIPT|nr:CLUMA_CG002597, isoform A [Clunio marinus]